MPSTNAHDRRWTEVRPNPARAVLCTGDGYPLFRSKSKAGKLTESDRIIRSRVTLATIEAAAIETQGVAPYDGPDGRPRGDGSPVCRPARSGFAHVVEGPVRARRVGRAAQTGEGPPGCQSQRHGHPQPSHSSGSAWPDRPFGGTTRRPGEERLPLGPRSASSSRRSLREPARRSGRPPHRPTPGRPRRHAHLVRPATIPNPRRGGPVIRPARALPTDVARPLHRRAGLLSPAPHRA